MTRPLLAITMGDPAGIGPFVAVAAALHPGLRRLCRPLLVGDAGVIKKTAARPCSRVLPLTDPSGYRDHPRFLNVLHVPHPRIHTVRPGTAQKTGGESAALAVRTAVALALQKRVAAVVTGPVSKESLRLAGLPFSGHTEMLAALTGSRRVEMVMAAEWEGRPLMALLTTRHLPLKEVPRRLTASGIVGAVRAVHPWLKRLLKGRAPRWVVCGLNPHAGENGLLGDEEKRVVAPAVRRLRHSGISVQGPLASDAAWVRHVQGLHDIVACLYHDQAMIPLKTLCPRGVVNITAGLPFVRTSPGHGTAFDLAGGSKPFARADPSATVEACRWALRLAGHR